MINVPQTIRPERGKSIIAFPSSYVIVDIETTGFSSTVDKFISLVQPPTRNDGIFVDEFTTALTGITNDMLANAQQTGEVIRNFAKYLGQEIIVGYNVSFDVNFLYDNFVKQLGKPLTNNFIDVMRFSRKLYPEMASHRLQDMITKFGLVNDNAHRAYSDAKVTQECYSIMKEEALKQFQTEQEFAKSFRDIRASDIIGDASKVNQDSPLYGRCCVFTGKLEKFTRREAMQIVADLGGINGDNVTTKTNFLILGNNDYCTTIKDGKSSKHKKAEKLKLAGQDIEILPETDFYDMLYEKL